MVWRKAVYIRVVAMAFYGGGTFVCCVRMGGLTAMLVALLATILILYFGLMFGWAVCRYGTYIVDYLIC